MDKENIELALTILKGVNQFVKLAKNLNDSPKNLNDSPKKLNDFYDFMERASKAVADQNCINNSNYKTEDVEKYINDPLKNKTLLNNLIAQFTPVDHRGIMFLGPSGAGKTTLINAFIPKTKQSSEKLSTTGIERKYITLFNKMTCLRDTFGRALHGDRHKMLINECINEPPRILCLVFANSYLQTVDDNHLARGQSANFKNEGVDEYLKHTKQEEIAWIRNFIEELKSKKPRCAIQDLVIVVNKMDLWCENITKYQEVEDYYTQNEDIKKLFNILVDRFQKPHFLAVSSEFDSFMKGEVGPVKGFSRYASELSISLLRAYISVLLRKER